MRERIWPLLAFVVLLAALFYTAFQATFFYRLTTDWVAEERSIATQAGGVGVLLRNADLRHSLANPDFNYDLCTIDLRHGPYLIQGPDEAEYWSIAIFNRHGEAVFSTATGGAAGPFLVYAKSSPTPSESGDRQLVEVPEAQGIAVFRLLADRTNRKSLSDLQDELHCTPFLPRS
jgi:uncharacterized membrane protein